MTIQCTRVPAPDHPSYIAAKAMLHSGPLRPEQVFELADFGPIRNRLARLNPTIDSGWLQYVPGGRLIVSQFAVDHFNTKPPAPKWEGEVVPPREPMPFKPMSAKHRPDTRGRRPDAMDNSLAAMPSHWAKAQP